MIISDKKLKEFKKIYKKYYGRDIDTQTALDQAIKLIKMLEVIYKPMTVADWNAIQQKRKEERKKNNNY